MTKTIKETIVEMGGKEWSKNGFDRVYVTPAILSGIETAIGFEQVSNFSERGNTIWFDCKSNQIWRSYKNKKAVVEISSDSLELLVK